MCIRCPWCNRKLYLEKGDYLRRSNKNEDGLIYCSISCGLRKHIPDEKKCAMCKEVKTISEFYKNKARYDNVSVYCKPCFKSKSKKYQDEHPEMKSLVHKKRRLRQKIQLFKILGSNSCVFCGFSIWQALQFEHIKGDGTQDKNKFKCIDDFFKYYIENEDHAREKLQIACANCNWIKRFKNNESITMKKRP